MVIRCASTACALLAGAACAQRPPTDVAVVVGDPPDARAVTDVPSASDAPPAVRDADLDASSRDDIPTAADVPMDLRPSDFGRLGVARREGDTVTLRTHATVNYRGVDAAYDPTRRVFLVVYGNAPIGGAFLDDEGRQLGDGFRLTDTPFADGNWTQNPRVVFGGGGFAVSWHHESGRGVVPVLRRVVYTPGGPMFPAASAVLGAGSMQESGIALAWSDERREFLAVWSQSGTRARRVSAEGVPQGDAQVVSDEGVWTEQPGVVWSAEARGYFATFMQESAGRARVAMQRLDATGARVGAARDLTGPLEFAKVTDMEMDLARGEIIASWYQVRGGVRGFAAQRFSATGEPRGEARTVFAPHGSYDGYDLAWSAATGTALGVFHGDGAEDMGAELDVDLVNGNPFAVTASGARNGDFLPRAVAHPTRPFWIVLSSADYARVVAQRVARSPR